MNELINSRKLICKEILVIAQKQ